MPGASFACRAALACEMYLTNICEPLPFVGCSARNLQQVKGHCFELKREEQVDQ